MKRYLFGYLFVRFSKLIAILLVLGGFIAAGVKGVQANLEAASLRYEGARQLGGKLMALSKELDRTRELTSAFLKRPASTSSALLIGRTPTSTAEFMALETKLGAVGVERSQFKEGVIEEFDKLVNVIELKLRAHADSLEEKPALKEKAPAAPSADPAPEAAETKSLFAILNRAELALRREVIDQSREFLSLLESTSENPENQKVLSQALRELSNLESLFPADIDVVEKPRPAKRDMEPTPAPSAPRAKLKAERVADQLNEVRRIVRASVLTDWSIDRAFEAAEAEVERERKKCLEAERSMQRLWLSAISLIGLILIVSVFIGFLILVLADLTQSLLDTATSTSYVATIYEASQNSE